MVTGSYGNRQYNILDRLGLGGLVGLLGLGGRILRLGRVPGDILITKASFTLFFTIVTSLLISLIFSLILSLGRRP